MPSRASLSASPTPYLRSTTHSAARARHSVHSTRVMRPSTNATTSSTHPTPARTTQIRHLHRPEGRLCLVRQGRLGHRHRPPRRRHLERTELHRDRRRRVRLTFLLSRPSPNRSSLARRFAHAHELTRAPHSFGLQIGADLSEFVIVLNDHDAVAAFAKGGNVTIGGALAAAAGPIGVGGAVNTSVRMRLVLGIMGADESCSRAAPQACTDVHVQQEQGTLRRPQPRGNGAHRAQGRQRGVLRPADPRHRPPDVRLPRFSLSNFLANASGRNSGKVPPPEAASALYEAIEAAEGVDESGLPDNAYVVPDGSGVGGEGQKLFDAGAGH